MERETTRKKHKQWRGKQELPTVEMPQTWKSNKRTIIYSKKPSTVQDNKLPKKKTSKTNGAKHKNDQCQKKITNKKKRNNGVNLMYIYVPVKLKPLVSTPSFALASTRSHLPTTTQDPHSNVRSITMDPASNPIPTDT